MQYILPFPRQKLLHERALVLLCAYIACIFLFTNTGTVPTTSAHCSKLYESKATVNGEGVCVCVCVCVYVCVSARACVRACACVFILATFLLLPILLLRWAKIGSNGSFSFTGYENIATASMQSTHLPKGLIASHSALQQNIQLMAATYASHSRKIPTSQVTKKDTFAGKLNQQADSSADSSDSLERWIQVQSRQETDILTHTFWSFPHYLH